MPINTSKLSHADSTHAQRVVADEDLFDNHKGLGISTIDFKYTTRDSNGILILENTFREHGGPAKHLHYDQDEWFYAVEGNFIIEIGTERFTVKPGDSLLAPRKIPHGWGYIGGDTLGKMLITFMPAGKMEAFFNLIAKTSAMPSQDPELWRAYDMELLGPPLSLH